VWNSGLLIGNVRYTRPGRISRLISLGTYIAFTTFLCTEGRSNRAKQCGKRGNFCPHDREFTKIRQVFCDGMQFRRATGIQWTGNRRLCRLILIPPAIRGLSSPTLLNAISKRGESGLGISLAGGQSENKEAIVLCMSDGRYFRGSQRSHDLRKCGVVPHHKHIGRLARTNRFD
jgi:hypothetical protein